MGVLWVDNIPPAETAFHDPIMFGILQFSFIKQAEYGMMVTNVRSYNSFVIYI